MQCNAMQWGNACSAPRENVVIKFSLIDLFLFSVMYFNKNVCYYIMMMMIMNTMTVTKMVITITIMMMRTMVNVFNVLMVTLL